jgi:hypothetical protein
MGAVALVGSIPSKLCRDPTFFWPFFLPFLPPPPSPHYNQTSPVSKEKVKMEFGNAN